MNPLFTLLQVTDYDSPASSPIPWLIIGAIVLINLIVFYFLIKAAVSAGLSKTQRIQELILMVERAKLTEDQKKEYNKLKEELEDLNRKKISLSPNDYKVRREEIGL